jgi:hypothetical protein
VRTRGQNSRGGSMVQAWVLPKKRIRYIPLNSMDRPHGLCSNEVLTLTLGWWPMKIWVFVASITNEFILRQDILST